MGLNRDFWRGRRTLVTGHTGFKGAWLALWLEKLDAEVTAIALPPPTTPSLYEALGAWSHLESVIGDLRDPEMPIGVLTRACPEIVFHLAAQALVLPSYNDPVGTFTTNVLGTVHLLEAIRGTPSVKVAIVVTSDKVYCNDESGRPFQESDRLGGRDPYSASKTCQEMVTSSYRDSFFGDGSVRVASARAGNVIGGGDWGADRLIPDFMRSMVAGEAVRIRNPDATRSWQHVLDPLAGYLSYAEQLYAGTEVPPALNFGPRPLDARPVRWMVDQLVDLWGEGADWLADEAQASAEAKALTLDASLATRSLDWSPRLALEDALDWTVAWYRAHAQSRDMRALSLEQIDRYEELRP